MTSKIIERVGPDDRFADYCLWDYAPVKPAAGKLRSSTLLWKFLEVAGCSGSVRDCCEALRAALGPFQTVWGIKQRGGTYSFEFYFYDYGRLERTVSVSRVLRALSPHLASSIEVSEGRPYFMFSLDIDDNILASGTLDQISLYIGNPGSSVSSGLCYNVSGRGLRLDNLYYFFDRATQLADIRAKVACSAHLDLCGFPTASILWPDLMDCGVVVVANKRFNDGIYFSRLPLAGFLRFVRKGMFPEPFVSFVEDHLGDLDHLLFDVGFDYVLGEGGISIVKTAIYGLL